MQEHTYFQDALANFTHEAASGGAIRHLADLGYTVKQIAEQLDFPTPYERVQKTVWEHLLHTGVILSQEPGRGGQKKKPTYVREYDSYGKTSFRLVESEDEGEDSITWREQWLWMEESGLERVPAGAGTFDQAGFLPLLEDQLRENGESHCYMSCDFGVTAYREPERFQAMLEVLEERQREYIVGLPWEMRRSYHRLDSRMREILMRLCRAGLYQGECYFLNTKDKVMIETRLQ